MGSRTPPEHEESYAEKHYSTVLGRFSADLHFAFASFKSHTSPARPGLSRLRHLFPCHHSDRRQWRSDPGRDTFVESRQCGNDSHIPSLRISTPLNGQRTVSLVYCTSRRANCLALEVLVLYDGSSRGAPRVGLLDGDDLGAASSCRLRIEALVGRCLLPRTIR
jgi:hypothetical protein